MLKDRVVWIPVFILISLTVAEQTAWGNSTPNTRTNLSIAAYLAYSFLSVYLLVKAVSRRKQITTTKSLFISLLLIVPAFLLIWAMLAGLALSAG